MNHCALWRLCSAAIALGALGQLAVPFAAVGGEVAKCYVTTNTAKTAVYPYDTWDTAAHDLNTALSVGSPEIEVGDGTYVNTADCYVLDRAVKVYSAHGPEKTVLQAKTNSQQFKISSDGAVLSGFTLTDGKGNSGGKNVISASAGVISNCVMNGRISFVYASYCRMSGSAKMVGCDLDMSGFYQATTDSTCAPLYLEGSAIAERCRIHGWTWTTGYYRSNYKSAVIIASANAVLRNSLVYGNTNGKLADETHRRDNFNGGGVRLDNGTVENCTIVDNASSNNGGGIYAPGSTGKIVNCIVWGNTAKGGVGSDIYAPNLPAENVTYVCSADVGNEEALPNGVGCGCSSLNPNFSAEGADPYALTLNSVSCVDKGGETEASCIDGAVDLIGNPRLDWKSGVIDIGCYEYVPSHETVPLSASIEVRVPSGYGAKDVSFIATPIGDCTDGLSWCWHFGDGEIDAVTLTPTHRYQPGDYEAYLSLTNVIGETTNVVCSAHIIVVPQTVYVAADGKGIYPYDTSDKAVGDLNTALSVGSPEIEVGDGTYVNTADSYVLDRAVKVYSAHGPEKTVLQAKTNRQQFKISSDGAVLSGFTLTGGKGDSGGRNVITASAGVISNCVMNGRIAFAYSSCFSLSGSARLVDCDLDMTGFYLSATDGDSAPLRLEGSSLADRCTIHGFKWTSDNSGSHYKSAVIIASANAVLRNSLVYDNANGKLTEETHRMDNFNGGGVRLNDGAIENCTIVGNASSNNGGGIYAPGTTGKIVNCIVWGNTAKGGVGSDIYAPNFVAGNISYTCASDVGDSTALPAAALGPVCLAKDPRFRRAQQNDFRLLGSSPCRDIGDESIYPDVSSVRDLLGNPRTFGGQIDLGCYETKAPGLVLLLR